MNRHVKKSEDLVTTYAETKAGFLMIALRKSKEASHYVDLGNAFRAIAEAYEEPEELLDVDDITVSMCEAAGLSTKAQGYLLPEDTKELLANFVEEFLSSVPGNYVDELISRYMLTQGDALGGRMRNIVGGLANERLTDGIVAALRVRNFSFEYFAKDSKTWCDGKSFDDSTSRNVKALKWSNGEKSRLLYYDLTVPTVKKNIDIVVFNNSDIDVKSPKKFKAFKSDPKNYLTLGELKGGIDPAGADEHWKTANTALDRIRTSFGKIKVDVNTVFVGAAIEKAMAEEIFNQCKKGILTNCANLTKVEQLTEVCDWLATV